jgi:hypothetical protein
MPWSFKPVFFDAKPGLLMICRKTEPGLIKGDNELLTIVFDGPELAQELN